jgi:hypothetical protein
MIRPYFYPFPASDDLGKLDASSIILFDLNFLFSGLVVH